MDALLQRLYETTKEITDNPDHNPFHMENGNREMKLDCEFGSASSFGVYTNFNIAVALTVFEENTVLPVHHHPEKEVIEVLEGEIAVVFTETEELFILKQYDVLVIPPNMKHTAGNKVKTVIIANTMPASPYFPHLIQDPDAI